MRLKDDSSNTIAAWFIKKFGDEIYNNVVDRIMAGDRLNAISKDLSAIEGVTDSPKYVSKQLSILKGALLETYTLPVKIIQQSASFRNSRVRIDILEELHELYATQKLRFDKLYKREKKAPLLMKQVSDEIKSMKETLVDIAKIHGALGILKKPEEEAVIEQPKQDKEVLVITQSKLVQIAKDIEAKFGSGDSDTGGVSIH